MALLLLAACTGSEARSVTASVSGTAEVTNRHADWWFVTAPDPEDLELRIAAITAASTCDEFLGFEVRGYDDELHVEAMVHAVGSQDCAPGLERRRFSVELREPLGDRAVDGCYASVPELRDPRLDDHDQPRDCRSRVRHDR